ncbi:MAG: class I SAM-dependent methyltransferase [Actinomycetota bacterium]|nr:class I SAM-dependent methyltransferase [Actinomycetota bacterium]
MSHVVWHDVECGSYVEDLPLWRDLARAEIGPVLDAGAGTGRVALDLARHGHAVVAVDRDPDLLAELRRRAGRLPIETVVADARSLELRGRSFGLIIAPMQLVQLLGGFDGRMGFLRAARALLGPDGLLACAVSESMDAFDGDGVLPLPDVAVLDGVRYSSQPVALRDDGRRVAIERIREITAGDGRRCAAADIIHLDRLATATFELEARGAGLKPDRRLIIRPTHDHVGSSVVMLRG